MDTSRNEDRMAEGDIPTASVSTGLDQLNNSLVATPLPPSDGGGLDAEELSALGDRSVVTEPVMPSGEDVQNLRDVVARNPHDVPAWIQLALTLVRFEDGETACIDTLNEALLHNQGAFDILFELGKLLFDGFGDIDDAVIVLQQACEINPGHTEALDSLRRAALRTVTPHGRLLLVMHSVAQHSRGSAIWDRYIDDMREARVASSHIVEAEQERDVHLREEQAEREKQQVAVSRVRLLLAQLMTMIPRRRVSHS